MQRIELQNVSKCLVSFSARPRPRSICVDKVDRIDEDEQTV